LPEFQDRVVALLLSVRPLQEGPVVLKSATDTEISEFEKVNQLKIPGELLSWLRVCNGAMVNPGCLYGIGFPLDVNMSWYLNEYPVWRRRGWYPIASDGCGNLYMFDSSTEISSTSTSPVFFLDQSDFSVPSCVVASGLLKFLFFLFQSELIAGEGGDVYWPMTKSAVLEIDPALEECDMPLPWDLA
jgi:hypothetical protein